MNHPRTIGELLAARVAEKPDADFLLYEDESGGVVRFTHAAMLDRARRVAHVLTGFGIQQGTRVHLHLDNRPEFLYCWFATALLGATVVPTNPLAPAEELAFIFEHAMPSLSITTAELAETVTTATSIANTNVPSLTISGDTNSGAEELATHVATVNPVPIDSPTVGDDVAAVLYTSGTTSHPKGVLVTHDNYCTAGRTVAEHLDMSTKDRWLVCLPLFHANAQYYCLMSALISGASIALAPRFSAARWGSQAASMGATLASLFAAPIRMILTTDPTEQERFCQLRATLFAQHLTDEQIAAFEHRFNTRLLHIYGMTETIAPATCTRPDGPRRPDSMGQALPERALRVVDSAGEDVATGEAGELLVGGVPGETLMLGYLHAPEATRTALRDGWLHTGDIVRVNVDGDYFFVDRAKDMIKHSGESVAAGEVERVLNDHPSILESAVVGVPDALRDESIVAHVVPVQGAPTTTEADLIAWCSARLSRFKVPDSIHLIDALPRTSVGKIRKTVLRTPAS